MKIRPGAAQITEQGIADLLPEVVTCSEMRGHGSWALTFPPKLELIFGTVTEGRCILRNQGGETIDLQCGDFLLTSNASQLTLLGPDQAAHRLTERSVSKGTEQRKIAHGSASVTTRLIAGHASLPATCTSLGFGIGFGLVVRQEMANSLQLTLACLIEEGRGRRGASIGIQQRLVQVLVLQASQNASLRLTEAFRDIDVPPPLGLLEAVREMRAEPARDWSVADLASVAFMSRSAFARKFEQVLGMPPLRYLREIRMSRAKQALLAGVSIKATAIAAGFHSDKAFRTAFRQRFDQRPDAFRRTRALQRDSDVSEPSEDES